MNSPQNKQKIVTASQMREIDTRATLEFGIPGIVLMENAGKAVAETADGFLRRAAEKGIIVFCGCGNNGGDGLVAARHLKEKGYGRVEAVLVKPPGYFKGDALVNYNLAEKAAVKISAFHENIDLSPFSLIIDALLGTGAKGAVSGTYLSAVKIINSSGKPVIAVDIPSGLDSDTGCSPGETVKAQITVTMALMKKGLANPDSGKYAGKIIIADIGIPEKLLR